MKIEFSLEVKPGTARRVAVVSATLIVLGAAAAVYANQMRFTSGQALTATDLNNNFDELYAKAAKPSITANGKSISVGGVFCGATSASYTGSQVGGYAGVPSSLLRGDGLQSRTDSSVATDSRVRAIVVAVRLRLEPLDLAHCPSAPSSVNSAAPQATSSSPPHRAPPRGETRGRCW